MFEKVNSDPNKYKFGTQMLNKAGEDQIITKNDTDNLWLKYRRGKNGKS
jgi:hypothetical protein